MTWYKAAIWSLPMIIGSSLLCSFNHLQTIIPSSIPSLLSLSAGSDDYPPCHANILLPQPPHDFGQVALHTYSYCAGILDIRVYIANLNFNKLVTLYYSDRHGSGNPWSAIELGYNSSIESTDYEIWAAHTPISVGGISKLLNLTYQALDIDQTFVQQLHINVTPSGGHEPDPPSLPAPYASPAGLSEDVTAWLSIEQDSQIVFSKQQMLSNIDPDIPGTAKGVVVAGQSGPSYPHNDPDYEYTWVRDTALTLDVYAKLYTVTPERLDAAIAEIMFDYAASRSYQQTQPGLQTGLGEVKFYLNNTIFREPWGRPQNDGPASAASTLIGFARDHLSKGGSLDVVRSQLWNPGPVLADLQIVAASWSQPCFDLWEEESSDHFYTRMVQRRALLEGSSLAAVLGDTSLAIDLSSAAAAITASLDKFWDSDRAVILYAYGPILHNKTSYLDVSTILAVLHGWQASEALFPPTDDRVLSTALQLSTAFLALYPIAHSKTTDSSGLPLGIPIGRYPEDIYTGHGMAPDGGNPWFLATSALAEIFFRAATLFRAQGYIAVSDISAPFWGYFAPRTPVKAGKACEAGTVEFDGMVDALLGWGDAFLRRVKEHAGEGGHLSEQFERNTGALQGCWGLTWSYAALISAASARADASGDDGYMARLAGFAV